MTLDASNLNELTARILGAAIRIHSRLGPGLLESVHERVLARDLDRVGYRVERQRQVSFDYDGLRFEGAFLPTASLAL